MSFPEVTFMFGLFSVQEFMTFTSALIVERTSPGSRASVKEQGNMPGFSNFTYFI